MVKVTSRKVVIVWRAVRAQELTEDGHLRCVSVIVEMIVEVVNEARKEVKRIVLGTLELCVVDNELVTGDTTVMLLVLRGTPVITDVVVMLLVMPAIDVVLMTLTVFKVVASVLELVIDSELLELVWEHGMIVVTVTCRTVVKVLFKGQFETD